MERTESAIPHEVRRLESPQLGLPSLPDGLLVELVVDHNGMPAGLRGYIRAAYGWSNYDFHVELPVENCGVPIEVVAVVERTEAGAIVTTPYLEWCHRLAVEILCPRCRRDIVSTYGVPCPELLTRERDRRHRRNKERALEARRVAWLELNPSISVPVVPVPLPNAHCLERGHHTIDAAQVAAPHYFFDFTGVHIVPSHDRLDIYAVGFREPADDAPHPFGAIELRTWPIPALV